MLLNPDTLTHTALNRWFSSSDIREIVPAICVAALKLEPDLENILSTGLRRDLQPRHGYFDSNAKRVALEMIAGTLDPELSHSAIGTRFKEKLESVAQALEISDFQFSGRDASEESLRRWFSGVISHNII